MIIELTITSKDNTLRYFYLRHGDLNLQDCVNFLSDNFDLAYINTVSHEGHKLYIEYEDYDNNDYKAMINTFEAKVWI